MSDTEGFDYSRADLNILEDWWCRLHQVNYHMRFDSPPLMTVDIDELTTVMTSVQSALDHISRLAGELSNSDQTETEPF